MIRAISAIAALLLLAAPVSAQTRSPVGTWLTENRGGVIEISARGDALYGRIVGLLKLAPGEAMPTDNQGQPRCGLEIINGLREDPPGEWFGTITNPEDGKVWDVRVTLDEKGNLLLRGYLLISLLGSTQTWTPYTGKLGPDCRPVP